uniref:Structural maintenance of chromosomes protein n=1 Tax=Mycena chlorophos TaxID=658473 RepID=A0ABQ0KYF7_MYCCL|nr:structural maintenance of chromosome protein 3 [Mycena chlorophos]
MVYIKSLTIQGLKSYRDQTQIEPFSPRHNVVVGRNGSGKSNFFAAIRFVLSDAYTSLTREERQALLHEGVSTTSTLSAYVEIVFDNSDHRFPNGNDELILRRTIGIKKDEYSLDKKSANKAEVMNLLESAGFSKSNPYYIVPQGRITALTNAKDTERLALLKEVAGTKVYEQRRAESLRIMAETDAKRTKINELLEYIDSRLTELEEEKEELKEFQEKDKDRRCLEYALFQRELEEVNEALEEIEGERRSEVHGANKRREKFNERQKEIQTVERNATEAKHSLDTATNTRQDVQSELTDLIRTRTELECIVQDLRNAGARAGGRREQLETELSGVEDEITTRQASLDALLPNWESARARDASERRALDEANIKLEALFAKRGRGAKFRTKAERDAYLRQEIAAMGTHKTTQTAALQTTIAQLQEAQKNLAEIEIKITGVQDKIEDGREKVKDLSEDMNRLKDEKIDLVEKRKDLWREDAKLESVVTRATNELKTAERALSTMMDKDTGTGLAAVDNIAERLKLKGVYGPLYRLFEITDPKYNIAVEQTAGNSLFHVVVDTDETASKVLDVMIKEKTGRVTFMPLNRLKPTLLPMPNAADAVPILEKIEYDPKHEKAFQQVFGKTCVCQHLQVAAEYVRSHGINTITIDGDRVDRKGALTGGFHDVKRSRLDAVKDVTSWRTKFHAESARLREAKASLVRADQEITHCESRIQVLNQQINQIRDTRTRLLEEGAALTRQKEKLKERTEKLEKDQQELETDLGGLNAKLAGYQKELQSPLTKGLTDEEEQDLIDLSEEVEKRKQDLNEISKNKSKLEGKKNAIEIELNERLRRRREELKSKLDGLGDPNDDSASVDNLESRERELRTLNNSIHTLTTKTQEMEQEIEGLQAKIQELNSEREQLQAQQAEDNRNMSRQQKTAERFIAKRQMLASRKDDCNRNIRDLGVLPEEAFQKYTGEKLDRLMKKLHAVNDGLKKFAHVNKKAFEQYSNFTKQRDQLLQRREDLDKSAESIEELVQVLDQRKDEAIERTFKDVARNFEEVFEKLVPAGRGRLIIQRRIDQDEEMDEDVDNTQQSTIDNYTGVSIKVSFNSKVDEGLRIQQLSGGQKSLVALATVFAIQKCDPAPFYLFDEIDANLDAQYRTAVASMIQSLAGSAQFIVTTFRPEMLVTADKFYGVLFNNQKVSSIRAIKREEAMEFVDQEAKAQ